MVYNILGIVLGRNSLGLVETGVREHVKRGTYDIFSDVPEVLRCEPSSHINIGKFKACARVGCVAPNDTWREYTTMNVDITHSDISHGNQGIYIAMPVQRIQHASWAATIWLLLLLSSNINAPPEWIFDFQAII